ncbi:MAG TPA: hypothetical protein DDW87_00450 [Firmicutes bacterium]|nr:hypothetical protein [Bacillota bacterium]
MKNQEKRCIKQWPLLLILLLCLGARAPYVTAAPSRYIDEVGILSAAEGQQLRQRLDQLSEAHQFDVVVAVVRDLDYREAHLFAADLFEERGFGYGPAKDGAILLLAMAERDFGFAALGFGLTAFTPAGQEYLDKLFLPDLKENRYSQAFLAFADGVDDFLTMAKRGTPYDSGNIPLLDWERNNYRITALAVSLVVALLAALTTAQIHRGKLKSLQEQTYAHSYIRQGSMVVGTSRDVFLYRTLTRQRREQQKSKGGKSFTTSSGRRSTGHSGKF